jgi:hypothetical protein
MNSQAQVIKAPSKEAARHSKSVFLAGTTTGPHDWRETLTALLSDLPITIFNPLRTDWGKEWTEDISCAPYREQVEWELAKQEAADVMVIFFGGGTHAPISLLELGLRARLGKAVVCIDQEYTKKGNVQIVCEKYNIEIVDNVAGFRAGIEKLLNF